MNRDSPSRGFNGGRLPVASARVALLGLALGASACTWRTVCANIYQGLAARETLRNPAPEFGRTDPIPYVQYERERRGPRKRDGECTKGVPER